MAHGPGDPLSARHPPHLDKLAAATERYLRSPESLLSRGATLRSFIIERFDASAHIGGLERDLEAVARRSLDGGGGGF